MKTFFQAAKKSQKLRYDNMNRHITILGKFAQPLAFNDLVAISGTADLHEGQAVTTTGKQ